MVSVLQAYVGVIDLLGNLCLFLLCVQAVKANLTYPLVSGIPYGLDLCLDIGSGINNSILPEMVFHFTNADVVLPIENLFLLADVTGPIVCLAIAVNFLPISIFGNVQQQNNLVVFDLENFQIGFKSITCG
jgi:hypothetical protein